MKLTKIDRELIEEDTFVRAINRHTDPTIFGRKKRSEYLVFLDKCIDHCGQVGDNEIKKKLILERNLFKSLD